MKLTLYRRMCLEEANKTIKEMAFFKPDSEIALTRKWFSTSLFRSHYFKSPFYNGESVILKVLVNDTYFKKIFEEGTFITKEPNGFYASNDLPDDILYAKAHRTINSLYNIGILNLTELNQNHLGIELVEDSAYCSLLEKDLLGQKITSLISNKNIDSPWEFYFQLPFDTAILALKYQCFMIEGINPIIKKLHLSKDLKELQQINLNKYHVTLKVCFHPSVKQCSKFNEYNMALNQSEIVKFLPFISQIKVVDVKELNDKEDTKNFINITGNNTYTKHQQVSYQSYPYLDYQLFEEGTLKLCKSHFKLDSLKEIIPNLEDTQNISQVDPRHIDMLDTHIEKVINMSNLVINYFKDQGFMIDSEMLVWLKWSLLIHDLGKPYCSCLFMTSRYSQFGDKSIFLKQIIDELLAPDISFYIKTICRIGTYSSQTGSKKLRKLIAELLKEILSVLKVTEEEAYVVLNKILYTSLLFKVSHSASLKPRSFCAAYVDDLQFFDRINDILLDNLKNDFVFPYMDLYYGVMDAYTRIVEEYYNNFAYSPVEQVQKMLKSDYQDLSLVYNCKNKYVLHLDDLKQYNYDELICAYFKDNSPLIKEYLSQKEEKKQDNQRNHGSLHCQKVAILSYLLGKLNNLDDEAIEILLLASKYHDIGRQVSDENHGWQSVKMLKDSAVMTNYQKCEYVYFLIEAHEVKDEDNFSILAKYNIDHQKALFLLSLFKDADALDRTRFDSLRNYGSCLNIKYLRNNNSKLLIKFSYLLNAQYKQDGKELSPSIKHLVLK